MIINMYSMYNVRDDTVDLYLIHQDWEQDFI